MFISLPQQQHDIYYLGIPYIVEQTHYGFWAVMDSEADSQIDDLALEGKILTKFFKQHGKNNTDT